MCSLPRQRWIYAELWHVRSGTVLPGACCSLEAGLWGGPQGAQRDPQPQHGDLSPVPNGMQVNPQHTGAACFQASSDPGGSAAAEPRCPAARTLPSPPDRGRSPQTSPGTRAKKAGSMQAAPGRSPAGPQERADCCGKGPRGCFALKRDFRVSVKQLLCQPPGDTALPSHSKALSC